MASLTICEEADRELDALYESHPDDAALIDALLEALTNDDAALASLCYGTPKLAYNANPVFKIYRFQACWDIGKQIYILKVDDQGGRPCSHRVIIAHDPVTDDHMVLATPNRGFNYDPDSVEFHNILDRYDAAGFVTSSAHR